MKNQSQYLWDAKDEMAARDLLDHFGTQPHTARVEM